MLKYINIVAIIIIFPLAGQFYREMSRTNAEDYQSHVAVSNPIEIANTTNPAVPTELNLDMEFHSQAPFGNWGEPYQEACEEASLLVAYNFIEDISVTDEEFDRLLNEMVDWEMSEFGKYTDTPIEKVAIIAEKYLGHSEFEIVENPSAEELRNFLRQGYPIIAPMSGQDLGNPFFTGDGPIFHALVIRGYEEGGFITNDVGTKHGENFFYPEDTFMNALHDWDESFTKTHEDMIKGAKKVLVIKPSNQL